MRRLLLPLALALSALGASSALAAAPQGAQKAPIFGPNVENSGFTCKGGAAPTPKTFGFVVLNTPGNDTTLSGEVALKGAAPNTTYAVDVEKEVPPTLCFVSTVGAITTNKKGNGNAHFTVARPLGTKFWIAVVNQVRHEVYGSPAVELD